MLRCPQKFQDLGLAEPLYLRQIQLQARALHRVIQELAVQKKLKLNDEQVKQIEGFLKEGLEEARKAARKGTEPARLRVADHIDSQQKAYAGTMKKIDRVFTPEQRRLRNDLAGETFVFKAAPSE